MTNIFQTGFDSFVCTGESITAEAHGFTFTATIHDDDDATPPWDREDGHEPVSDWTSRSKLPGELVLNDDRTSKRYYDYAEACRIARRDGWGMKGGKREGETARAYAARAAWHDYSVLRAWCRDEWSYCGIDIRVERGGVELVGEYESALWGVERNYPDSDNAYLLDIANEQADEAMRLAQGHVASLADELEA